MARVVSNSWRSKGFQNVGRIAWWDIQRVHSSKHQEDKQQAPEDWEGAFLFLPLHVTVGFGLSVGYPW